MNINVRIDRRFTLEFLDGVEGMGDYKPETAEDWSPTREQGIFHGFAHNALTCASGTNPGFAEWELLRQYFVETGELLLSD
jgi:hypothetical protein